MTVRAYQPDSPQHLVASLPADAASKLDVLRHDGHTLGVNRAEVGVLKEVDEVGLRGLLQGHDGVRLEAKVRLPLISNLAHETLERKLADQKLGRLLVLADLTERNSARAEAVGLLHTAGFDRCSLASHLGQLLNRGLAAGGLPGSLLGTRHVEREGNFGFEDKVWKVSVFTDRQIQELFNSLALNAFNMFSTTPGQNIAIYIHLARGAVCQNGTSSVFLFWHSFVRMERCGRGHFPANVGA